MYKVFPMQTEPFWRRGEGPRACGAWALITVVALGVVGTGCQSLKRSGQSLSPETYELSGELSGTQKEVAPEIARPTAQQGATSETVPVSEPKSVTNDLSAARPSGLSNPDDAGMDVGDAATYRIHGGDTLTIQVRGEDDLSGDFKVSSDGLIIYSLVGRIAVAGLTAATVEKNLTVLLAKDYLVNPKVYVQVRSSIMRRVIVFGEVRSPGVYELPVGERFTLLQAIARAGGMTDIAAADRVRIVRRTGSVEKVLKVSVADLLRGSGAEQDVELLPNDVITIPQTIF